MAVWVACLQGYSLDTASVQVGAQALRICALADRQQFSDPDGSAERAGIFSAAWPMFGVLWPSARVMAERMNVFPIEGKRILEIGCGLGLASLILQQRGADITASDHHPLADQFLQRNADLNGLAPIPFWTGSWSEDEHELGRFDLIIASDILYERDHPALVARFVARHARLTAQFVLADPGRGNTHKLDLQLAGAGWAASEERCAFADGETAPYRGRVTSYSRALSGPAAPNGRAT